jgi:hypothetical protein
MLALLLATMDKAVKSAVPTLLGLQLFRLFSFFNAGPRKTDSLPASDVQFSHNGQA